MADQVQKRSNVQGKPEAFRLFPAGNLAARIAGRSGRFGLISAAIRAGYRPEIFDQVVTMQQNFVTKRVGPVAQPEGALDGFAIVIRKTG